MFQASPITIGRCQAFVEEKRSTNSSRGKLDFMLSYSFKRRNVSKNEMSMSCIVNG